MRRHRCSVRGQIYAVTTATHWRTPLFHRFSLARAVVNTMRELETGNHVRSLAYVVMPDHIHWLIALRDTSLEHLMRRLKGSSAYQINQLRNARDQVWQPGYHDHAVRKEEELRSMARYIILNPVRAGLVDRVGDYPLWDSVWVDGDWPCRG